MKLNSFQLKIIALVLMTLAHIEYYLDINQILFIGQASYPIFAYLAAYGAIKTSNPKKYFLRLLIAGLIVQLPLFVLGFNYINIFVSLAIGVLAIYIVQSAQFHLLFPIFLFAIFSGLDYGLFGVLLTLSAFFTNYRAIYFGISLIILQIFWINILEIFYPYQWLSIFSIPFLMMYNFELGYNKLKWLFYVYYPLHVIIIVFIREFIL